jgi:hypothetical protein
MSGGKDVPAGHVFISYVRENSSEVDCLQRNLESVGIRVWRDTADLWPGEDWRAKIRDAIVNEALVFIACFSQKSTARQKSYQNEELTLAIEQLRLRRPNEPWLIPVRLDDCEIPDLEIGRGRSLASIQHADLFGDRSAEASERLIVAVLRILKRQGSGLSVQKTEISDTVVNSGAELPHLSHDRHPTEVNAKQDDTKVDGATGTATGNIGPYIGETLGHTRSISNFDPLLAAARNRPTAVAITGDPGTWRVRLMRLFILQLARRGATVVIIDPNGEARSLARELQAHGHNARVLQLGATSPAGILDPFSLSNDVLEKRFMAIEVLRLLLPRMSEERESAMIQAVTAVASRERPSLGKVVRYLEDSAEPVSQNLGIYLHSMTEKRLARLYFAPRGGTEIDLAESTTVLELEGLILPDATAPNRAEYSYEQRESVILLYLATKLSHRLLTAASFHSPRAIFLDEAWAVTSMPEGARLMLEISQIGHSDNTTLILVSRTTSGLLSEQITRCISSVFAFRSSDEAEIPKVMALLGVAASDANQSVIRRLRNEECIYRDLKDEVGTMKIDVIPDEMQH